MKIYGYRGQRTRTVATTNPLTGKRVYMPVVVKRRKLRPATAKAVKAIVRRTMDRENEDKKIGWSVDVAQHNSAISTADMYPCVQLIAQGDASWQREGARIRAKSLIIRGTVGVVTQLNQPDNRPLYVRIIIAAQKDVKVCTQTNTQGDANRLLRPATAGSDQIQFTGQLLQLNYPVNDLKFRVFMDKVVKLTPVTDASVETRGTQIYRFVKKVPCPKTLTFDTGNGDSCNNFAPFYALGYAYQDGGAPDVANTRVFSSVSSILTFED